MTHPRETLDVDAAVHTNTSHYYRDSSGRTRTEFSLSAVGPFTDESRTVVMISDPVARQRFVLHPDQKRAEALPLGAMVLATAAGGSKQATDASGDAGNSAAGASRR